MCSVWSLFWGPSAATVPEGHGPYQPRYLVFQRLCYKAEKLGQLSLMGHTLPTLDVDYSSSDYLLKKFLGEDLPARHHMAWGASAGLFPLFACWSAYNTCSDDILQLINILKISDMVIKDVSWLLFIWLCFQTLRGSIILGPIEHLGSLAESLQEYGNRTLLVWGSTPLHDLSRAISLVAAFISMV